MFTGGHESGVVGTCSPVSHCRVSPTLTHQPTTCLAGFHRPPRVEVTGHGAAVDLLRLRRRPSLIPLEQQSCAPAPWRPCTRWLSSSSSLGWRRGAAWPWVMRRASTLRWRAGPGRDALLYGKPFVFLFLFLLILVLGRERPPKCDPRRHLFFWLTKEIEILSTAHVSHMCLPYMCLLHMCLPYMCLPHMCIQHMCLPYMCLLHLLPLPLTHTHMQPTHTHTHHSWCTAEVRCSTATNFSWPL